ncbi:alpha/beta hydrolase [Nocardioides sp. 1609]|uniref:alpha/beta hydrolase n=1 Tax=Nocardioides sp. 1609 TaxID=2508327 RepID=UPI0014319575|nr:alpha/beta hydrolase [Nocardioides sp. 1609]
MPSLRHELLAYAVPRLRGAADPGEDLDLDTERERLARRNAALDPGLPTRSVPGFARRYEVATRTTSGPTPFPIHTIRRRGSRPRTTLYYLHGGGYVAPIDAAHVRYALRLADHLDAEVVLPDYPLAPAHTWRDSHRTLVDDLAVRTARQERVVVAGDSAGGGLALALTASLRDLRGHLPSHLVLHAPWVDLTSSTPDTYALDATDPWLSIRTLDAYAGWWAGDPADLGRPEVSPALGDLRGLPPTMVVAGTRDLLVAGCRLLADRAAHDGWPLTYLEAPDLIHVFPILPGLPEAARAWHLTQEFLR